MKHPMPPPYAKLWSKWALPMQGCGRWRAPTTATSLLHSFCTPALHRPPHLFGGHASPFAGQRKPCGLQVIVLHAGEARTKIQPIANGGSGFAKALQCRPQDIQLGLQLGIPRVGVEDVQQPRDAVLGHLSE